MNEKLMKWIGDYCAGTLDERDAAELRKWLDISHRNRDTFCKTVCEIRVYNALVSAERITGTFDEVARKRRKTRQRRSLFRAAASVTAAIVIIVICLRWHGIGSEPYGIRIPAGNARATLLFADGRSVELAEEKPDEFADLRVFSQADSAMDGITQGYAGNGSATHSIIVPAGGDYRFTLDDGTKVWLNSDTRITFPIRFDTRERCVSLVGEACFEVAEDRSRPFTVEFGGARLEVTGTRFGITAYPDCRRASVTLEEGGVRIGYNHAEVSLEPGTQASIDKVNGTIVTREVDTRLYKSWIDGVFEFREMALAEILCRISHWYGVEFRYASEDDRNIRFTGIFHKYDDLNALLVFIEKTSDLGFAIEGRTITVTRR